MLGLSHADNMIFLANTMQNKNNGHRMSRGVKRTKTSACKPTLELEGLVRHLKMGKLKTNEGDLGAGKDIF